MRHHGEVCLILPLLVRVYLANVVVAHNRGRDLGEFNLGDVLAGARHVSCAKLQDRGISISSCSSLTH